MVDITKAAEISEGILINLNSNGDRSEGLFLTGGPSSPVGLDLPTYTIYFQTLTNGWVVWRKVGTNPSDWLQLASDQVPFDDTLADQLTATSIQDAVVSLANRHFGKNRVYQTATSFETSSGTFQDALTFSGPLDAGTYRVQYGYTATNSKTNTNSEIQVVVDGNVINTRSQEGIALNSITSFDGDIVFAGGTFNGAIQVRRTVGNGLAQLTDIKGELWRVS